MIFSVLYIISHFTQTMPNIVLYRFLIDIQESFLVPRCLAWCITRQPFSVSIISQYTTLGSHHLQFHKQRAAQVLYHKTLYNCIFYYATKQETSKTVTRLLITLASITIKVQLNIDDKLLSDHLLRCLNS